MKVSIAQQLALVELAARSPPPKGCRASERDIYAEGMRAAAETLRFVKNNEAAIKEALRPPARSTDEVS